MISYPIHKHLCTQAIIFLLLLQLKIHLPHQSAMLKGLRPTRTREGRGYVQKRDTDVGLRSQ